MGEQRQRDTDPSDGRDESRDERMDRNWSEILQELRVTQTGTQILTGFLLTVAFQPRFGDLTPFQHTVYLVLVVTAVVTTALGLAPVTLHRGLFRRHRKALVVRLGNLFLRLTLTGVGLVLVGTVLLVVDIAAGRGFAYGLAGIVLSVVVAVAVLPLVLRRTAPEENHSARAR